MEGASITGVKDIEKEVRESFKSDPIEYKIGTMIELSSAALQADKIARYAEFFSLGTNVILHRQQTGYQGMMSIHSLQTTMNLTYWKRIPLNI